MSKTKTNAATVAAPAPNTPQAEITPAPREPMVTMTISEDTATALFCQMEARAEMALTGGTFESDYAAAAECARVLAELEAAWKDAPEAEGDAEAVARLSRECERRTAECERLTREVEELRRRK